MTVGLLTALLIAAIFIGILWNVGGDLVIGVLGHVLTVPKYLVIAVALYFRIAEQGAARRLLASVRANERRCG